jgi:RimJ/RimL family protein N-acetyltransferase
LELFQKTFDKYSISFLCENDTKEYFQFVDRNREWIRTYFPRTIASTKTESETKSYLTGLLEQMEEKRFYSFLIRDSGNQIVGTVFLKDLDWNAMKAEIGFFVDKDHEKRGIISRSVSLIAGYCFEELALNKLYMRIAVSNQASISVAEKNGFLCEGILRSDFKTSESELIDTLYYGLLKEDYSKTLK